ncbi:MAG: hypothetical protein ACJA0H_001069 [Francisellaceae bacterium]|jgi:hypothetical protein
MSSNEKSAGLLNREFSQNVSRVVNVLLNIALVASILYGAFSIVMLTNQESFSFFKSATIAVAMGTNIYILVSLKKMDAKKGTESKEDVFSLKLD